LQKGRRSFIFFKIQEELSSSKIISWSKKQNLVYCPDFPRDKERAEERKQNQRQLVIIVLLK